MSRLYQKPGSSTTVTEGSPTTKIDRLLVMSCRDKQRTPQRYDRTDDRLLGDMLRSLDRSPVSERGMVVETRTKSEELHSL